MAVTHQTKREADKFGYRVKVVRSQDDVEAGIAVSNYEMLDRFNPSAFVGIVLDESSILKAYDGSTRKQITESFATTPYRLACTATPAPNDHMELGTHAEFIGVMTRSEMLSMFFIHDGGDTAAWRLKGHAQRDFWRWLSSWAVMIRKPSDVGASDEGFRLPPLTIEPMIVQSEHRLEGYLVPMEAVTLSEQRAARRASLAERVQKCTSIVNADSQPWVVWCGLNDESEALAAAIPDSVEVTGSMPHGEKEDRIMRFLAGEARVLVSKVEICGFGLNMHHCARVAFVGLSHSWEQYYQAIRRCWRFGQTQAVQVRVILSDQEVPIIRNIRRKESDSVAMAEGMAKEMSEFTRREIVGTGRAKVTHETKGEKGDGWEVRLGDCVDETRTMADGSAGFAVFSPPFASLYTYSASDRDMGNCKNGAEFMEHFGFLIHELRRVLAPGRLVSFHCMNLPSTKERDGVIGLKDFRGDLIRAFQAEGFIYHSEVVIWKDPVTAMQRTKAIGLLYKQLRKDSALSRQGIPDYLVTMRNPGENAEPVTKTHESFPVGRWQNYASPVWMDINPSNTLQHRSVREDEDERHICPLQLGVIRRAIELWSNPGDLVLDPFAGIGSTGDVALRMNRKFLGIELKSSYWKQAVANCEHAGDEARAGLLV